MFDFNKLFPATLAHHCVAYWATHSCAACIFFHFSCFSFLANTLLFVANSTCLWMRFECFSLIANTLHHFWTSCFDSVPNTRCVPMLAEEANTAIARYKASLPTPLWTAIVIFQVSIPISCQTFFKESHCQVHLEASPSIVLLLVVLVPFFVTKICCNQVGSKDNTIQKPEEDAEIPAICSNRNRPVCIVSVHSINSIHVLGIVRRDWRCIDFTVLPVRLAVSANFGALSCWFNFVRMQIAHHFLISPERTLNSCHASVHTSWNFLNGTS